jgi:large subunit ribosomal protein L9
MPVKVILLQDVSGLGTVGDIKTVADGYARNFLLPRQMVTPATPAALATLNERIASEKRRQEKIRAELTQLTERIKTITLKFAVRVGGQNRLYGSVTSQNIADALREQEGIIVDRRAIILSDPLRQLGTFHVPIRLGQGFEPNINVELAASEE